MKNRKQIETLLTKVRQGKTWEASMYHAGLEWSDFLSWIGQAEEVGEGLYHDFLIPLLYEAGQEATEMQFRYNCHYYNIVMDGTTINERLFQGCRNA